MHLLEFKRAIKGEGCLLRRDDFELDRPYAALARVLANAGEQGARNPAAARFRDDVKLLHPEHQPAAFDRNDLVRQEDRNRAALALAEPKPGRRMRREREVDSTGDAVRIRRQPMLDQLCGQEAVGTVAVGLSGRTKHQVHDSHLTTGMVRANANSMSISPRAVRLEGKR